MFEYLTLGLLVIIVIAQYLKGLKSLYKITYYETRLEHNGIDIDHMKTKSLWAMFFD